MMHYLILLAFCFGYTQTFSNEGISGKVISVIDGNTVELLADGNEKRVVVLAGIDSPELTQEYGDKAKRYLEKLLMNKQVVVQLKGKDRKGNFLAIVLLQGELDVRIELLKEGLAWTSENNPTPELEAYRVRAQEKGKGLWKEENPTPPWTYRRQLSMQQPKSS